MIRWRTLWAEKHFVLLWGGLAVRKTSAVWNYENLLMIYEHYFRAVSWTDLSRDNCIPESIRLRHHNHRAIKSPTLFSFSPCHSDHAGSKVALSLSWFSRVLCVCVCVCGGGIFHCGNYRFMWDNEQLKYSYQKKRIKITNSDKVIRS